MAKLTLNLPISRPRMQWYISGAVVLVGTLTLFAYIVFVQASAAFAEGGASVEAFQSALGERIVKGLIMVLTMGLFLFFFVVQDYRITFHNLLERLSFVSSKLSESESTEAVPGVTSLRSAAISDLALIENSVESMLSENRAYRDRLDAQRNSLRDDYLVRLLKGWLRDTPTTHRVSRTFGLDMQDCEYLVMVTGTSFAGSNSRLHEESISMAYLQMQLLLGQSLEQLLKMHAVTVDDKLACLIVAEQGESLDDPGIIADLEAAVKLCQHMVFDDTRITLQSALGGIGHDFLGVSDSFAKATENYNYAQLIGDGRAVALSRSRVEPDEDEQLGSTWSKLERQILNCINAEEFGRAEELFNEMIDGGYISGAPTLELARHRMLNLTTLLVNALDKAGTMMGWDDNELQAIRSKALSCPSLSRLRAVSTEAFATLTYQSSSRRKQSSYLRIMEIIDYIETNYQDDNLSVNQIAAEFDMNASYLSRNFKKMMSVGLSDYIRHIRVQKAKELLQDDAISVKQAAEMVGFSNVLTMNRAFKKEEGTTAGRLRNVGSAPDILDTSG